MTCSCWLDVGVCKCETYTPTEKDKMKLKKQVKRLNEVKGLPIIPICKRGRK